MVKDDFFKVQRSFAFDLCNLSGNSTKLYLILRQAVNEDRNDGNLAFPSYSFIREKTRMSNKSIRKSILELIEKGWIREVSKGFNSVNKYYLNDTKSSSIQGKPLENEVVSKDDESSIQEKPEVVSNGNLSSIQGKHEVVSQVETNKNKLTRISNKNNVNKNKEQEEENSVSNESSISSLSSSPSKKVMKLFPISDENYPVYINKLNDYFLSTGKEYYFKLIEEGKKEKINLDKYWCSTDISAIRTIYRFVMKKQSK